jgi:hypothetical protein
MGQIESKIVLLAEPAGTPNERGRQIGPGTPISRIVGIDQGGAANPVTQSHCLLELAPSLTSMSRTLSRQGSCANAITRNCLAQLRQRPPCIARVSIHDARQTGLRNEHHHSRKQRLADIHVSPQGVSPVENYTKMRIPSSIRHQAKSTVTPCQYWLLHESTAV